MEIFLQLKYSTTFHSTTDLDFQLLLKNNSILRLYYLWSRRSLGSGNHLRSELNVDIVRFVQFYWGLTTFNQFGWSIISFFSREFSALKTMMAPDSTTSWAFWSIYEFLYDALFLSKYWLFSCAVFHYHYLLDFKSLEQAKVK